jgi:hypothetical protein
MTSTSAITESELGTQCLRVKLAALSGARLDAVMRLGRAGHELVARATQRVAPAREAQEFSRRLSRLAPSLRDRQLRPMRQVIDDVAIRQLAVGLG